MTTPPKPNKSLDKPVKGVKKKWWIIGGTGAALVTVWYVRKQNAAATATAADTSTVDPNIDPSTGIPYSQEYYEDGTDTGSYGYGSSGSGGTVGTGTTGIDDGTGTTAGTGTTVGNGSDTGDTGSTGTTDTGSTGTSTYASNAVWAQAAEATLSELGYDSGTSTAGVTAYLAGSPLTSDQANAVETAIALIGPPPQAVPPISIAPPAGQDSPGSGSGTTSAQQATQVKLSVSPSSGAVGSKVTVTATVTDTKTGAGTPQGTITIQFGAQTATVAAPRGSTSFEVGQPTNGVSHNVSATYAGNAAHQSSQSAVSVFTVTGKVSTPTGGGTSTGGGTTTPTGGGTTASSGPIPTTTTISVSPKSGKIGSTVKVSAIVADVGTSSPGSPGGTITITFGAQTANVPAPQGTATFTVKAATNGVSHNVSAAYKPSNTVHSASQSPATVYTVTK